MALNQTLIGSHTVFLSETSSTNDSLKLLFANEALAEGSVLYTSFQSSGRGQQEANWESESGKNLLMSVLLKPTFLQAEEQLWLNICVSLALKETITEISGCKSFIKWPNDIYAQHHKIAGILIENVLQGSKIKFSIIGIGLNINQVYFKNNKAKSLCQLAEKQFNVNEARKILCKNLDHFYLLLRQKQWPILWDLYHQNLYGKGEMAKFILNGKEVTAQILGLDRLGKLHLLIEDEVKSFANREVTFVDLIP